MTTSGLGTGHSRTRISPQASSSLPCSHASNTNHKQKGWSEVTRTTKLNVITLLKCSWWEHVCTAHYSTMNHTWTTTCEHFKWINCFIGLSIVLCLSYTKTCGSSSTSQVCDADLLLLFGHIDQARLLDRFAPSLFWKRPLPGRRGLYYGFQWHQRYQAKIS